VEAPEAKMRGAALLTTFATLSCAEQVAFNAAERATAISPRGDVAAEYDLQVDGRPFAELEVWSEGVWRDDADGREGTLLHVGFDLENRTRATLWFDADDLYVDSVEIEDGGVAEAAPVSVEGTSEIPPHGAARVEAVFEIADRVDPDDVRGFQAHWTLRTETRAYSQRTPFRRAPDVYEHGYPYWYSPMQDPYYEGIMVPNWERRRHPHGGYH
jgi:hypothetical protein